ncbi:hypothetical protein M9H77_20410 [Catharanthus roseus]|uniref:Uncharacterized protein n=1 Tax=Catharanthus roseus TaxID=4058 RepID=A0ACC0AKX3_CATRO|nr:hypothetical protein M9H77_20410 [Catharanthus roseus]
MENAPWALPVAKTQCSAAKRLKAEHTLWELVYRSERRNLRVGASQLKTPGRFSFCQIRHRLRAIILSHSSPEAMQISRPKINLQNPPPRKKNKKGNKETLLRTEGRRREGSVCRERERERERERGKEETVFRRWNGKRWASNINGVPRGQGEIISTGNVSQIFFFLFIWGGAGQGRAEIVSSSSSLLAGIESVSQVRATGAGHIRSEIVLTRAFLTIYDAIAATG